MVDIESAIDRITPTHCPAGRKAMWQSWRRLLFLHWSVPVAALRPLIPPELTVDTWEGRAYVGLVPFTMLGVRPSWSPSVRGLSNFHETNVRTYVHLNGKDPGVWFFSLDAANAIAVRLARAAWKLPYHFAEMHIEDELNTGSASVSRADLNGITHYTSKRLWPGPIPGDLSVRYRPTGTPNAGIPDTLEHFLAERYLLYTKSRGRLYRGQVHHSPYPLQTAEIIGLHENLLAAAKIDRGDGPPIAHFASGVDVKVFPLRTVLI